MEVNFRTNCTSPGNQTSRQGALRKGAHKP